MASKNHPDNLNGDSRRKMPMAECAVLSIHGVMEPVATLEDGRRWYYCNGCNILRSPSLPRVLSAWHERY